MTTALIEKPVAIAIRAMGEDSLEYLRLGCLRLDERNVRTDAHTSEEIEELADLIDAQGLLQNLTVVLYAEPHKEKTKGKKKGGSFTHGVIAGGGRWRALLLLVQRGRLTLDEQILCKVVPEERALAVSLTENSGRKPMSTADTVVAFADMVRAGAGIEDLAVCFHLSPLTVQRRLRLANVSPLLFDLFRKEEMTLDQLMALALTEDHSKQEAAWEAAPAYDRGPSMLRRLIAGEGLSKAVIRFVTVAGYEAAGGGVLRDLFADENDHPEYILDPALMMRLATEKLEGIAQSVRDEGLPWVEVFDSWGYSEREQFSAPPSTKRSPTEEEAASLADLSAKADALYEKIEAEYDKDDDEGDQEEIARLEAEVEAIVAQKDAIEAGLRVVLPEISALTGAAIYIDHQGQPKIERNLLRKADLAASKRAAAKAETTAGGNSDGANADAGADDKGGVSDRLCHQLTAHRTRALQASLLGNERAALAALVHPLLTRLLYGPGAMWDSPSAIKATAENCESQLATWAPDLADSRAEKVMQEAMQEARDMLPAEVSELLPWLLAQPMDTLVQLLTLCSALSLNAINGNGKKPTTAALANVVNLNMADWWAPTASSYLGSVSKALIVEALKDEGLNDDAEALAKLKKGEAVARAEALLAGRGWVPSVLR